MNRDPLTTTPERAGFRCGAPVAIDFVMGNSATKILAQLHGWWVTPRILLAERKQGSRGRHAS